MSKTLAPLKNTFVKVLKIRKATEKAAFLQEVEIELDMLCHFRVWGKILYNWTSASK